MMVKEMHELTKRYLQLASVCNGSILLVFNCFGSVGLKNICDMTDSGELKSIMISIFSSVSPLFAKLSADTLQKINVRLLDEKESKAKLRIIKRKGTMVYKGILLSVVLL